MFWRLSPAIVLLSAAMPLAARAQVDIDQDKTPAHIFSSDCSVCHKSTRGLANGRGNSELTSFLSEHYTSSRQEATAMAAYVLAGGGAVGKPTPAREEKPAAEGGNAPAEQPKTREARKPAKPDEEPAAAGKPTRTANQRGKHDRGQRTATAEPGGVGSEAKPAAEPHEMTPGARAHGRQKPAEAVAPSPAPEPQPAAVAAAPTPAEPLKPENAAPSAPSVAAPQRAEPAAAPAGERDKIPD